MVAPGILERSAPHLVCLEENGLVVVALLADGVLASLQCWVVYYVSLNDVELIPGKDWRFYRKKWCKQRANSGVLIALEVHH